MARTLRWDCSDRQVARQRGFSLTEMMVAIGIMGLILAVALPAYRHWRQSTALQGASRTLMAHLKQARLMAVSGNRTVRIVFAADRYTLDAGGTHEQQYPLNEYADTLVFTDVSFSGNKLTFNSSGTANSGHVVMRNADGVTHKITVNIMGRPYD